MREKYGTSQREFAENLYKIMKETPQVWLVSDIPISQVTLPLTQLGFPESTGGQQEAKYYIIVETPGSSKAHRKVRIQLGNKL